MTSKGRKPPYDESNLYEHWAGKRTKMADVLTAAEVGMLEDVVAPLQEEYHGPALGSQHVYVKHPQGIEMSGGKELPEVIEARRLERARHWEQRDADHARAMRLDQRARELQRYCYVPHVQPPPPRLSNKRRQIAEDYLERMRPKQWGAWTAWAIVTRPDGSTYQERARSRA